MSIIQRFLDAWDWFWGALQLPFLILGVIYVTIFFYRLFTGRISIRTTLSFGAGVGALIDIAVVILALIFFGLVFARIISVKKANSHFSFLTNGNNGEQTDGSRSKNNSV
jgi:hypothetical protein